MGIDIFSCVIVCALIINFKRIIVFYKNKLNKILLFVLLLCQSRREDYIRHIHTLDESSANTQLLY